MKIDLVYLWVDGSDEKWLAKKNEALAKANKPPLKKAISDNRWRDNEELKYSLRSAEKFAPWINHIFIVTDRQTPKWLDFNNPKITVVDQNNIIPDDLLPVFNSIAIEMFLWNIDGLSEYFIYANDDMFFGKAVEPDFFFDENKNPITIFKDRPYSSMRRMSTHWNALQVVYNHFGIKYSVSLKHGIEPFRKSYMKETAEKFYDEVVLPSATPFRSKQNVKRMIYPLIDNALGRNTITMNWRVSKKRIVYDRNKSSLARLICRELLWLFATIFGFIKYDCFDKRKHILTFLKLYRPTMFCINDIGASDDVSQFLGKMFPDKACFEL